MWGNRIDHLRGLNIRGHVTYPRFWTDASPHHSLISREDGTEPQPSCTFTLSQLSSQQYPCRCLRQTNSVDQTPVQCPFNVRKASSSNAPTSHPQDAFQKKKKTERPPFSLYECSSREHRFRHISSATLDVRPSERYALDVRCHLYEQSVTCFYVTTFQVWDIGSTTPDEGEETRERFGRDPRETATAIQAAGPRHLNLRSCLSMYASKRVLDIDGDGG